MDDFVARTSRWRTGFLVIGSIAGVAIGIWMAGLFGPPPVSRGVGPGTDETCGWLLIVFFGMCGSVSAKIWWKNGEQLRIGKMGIIWLRWSEKIIPWGEIMDVTEWNFNRTSSIVLHIRHPNLFPGRGILGLVGRANRALTGGDISITLTGTDRTFDEAMAAISSFWRTQ